MGLFDKKFWSSIVFLVVSLVVTAYYFPRPENCYLRAVQVFGYGFFISVITGKITRWISDRLNVHELIVEFFEDFVVVVGLIFTVGYTVSELGVQVQGLSISVSAVVGLLLSFGFKDLLTNISAGAWISIIEPFEIGDRVKVAGFDGIVKEINATNIVLEDSEGNTVVIPTKNAWNTPIIKYREK